MSKKYISIPYAVELTDEKIWDHLDDKDRQFFILRFHFMLESIMTDEPHCNGEKMAVFDNRFGSQEYVSSLEIEKEDIDLVESVNNSLLESKALTKLASNIAGSASAGGMASLKASINSSIKTELKESFSINYKVNESHKVRKKVTYTIKNNLGPTATTPVVAVPVYQRCACDIYLACIDWLMVDYQKQFFGLRKKLRKKPVIVEPNKHPNRCLYGMPLATAYFWRHLPLSSKLIPENEYTCKVQDADEIEISGPRQDRKRVVEFPKVPTLYQIANATFPLKWVKRKGDWTEEELMEIEIEESKGTPWWYRHGPGRRIRRNSAI